ncbi:hypothetical protein MKK75_04790 [Methylobacterium sp. J-030]|uniref:hypothetical protein n=1 Tax=Methylobacterium sp. J-030 TaxID=2836627 RepID=UPI001FBBCE7D|nr:hypothetical protein [Methylobacterium sp. J-030]MCJ2068133.1 hypothetical protein [Methylobacterium sp. J-030]
MAKAIHLICHRQDGRYKNLQLIGNQTYRSGYWKISEADAQALIGGWVYLHERKAEPSGFGGRVTKIEPTASDYDGTGRRYGLVFEACREGRGQVWRGAGHPMAWTGGLTEATAPHEAAG